MKSTKVLLSTLFVITLISTDLFVSFTNKCLNNNPIDKLQDPKGNGIISLIDKEQKPKGNGIVFIDKLQDPKGNDIIL